MWIHSTQWYPYFQQLIYYKEWCTFKSTSLLRPASLFILTCMHEIITLHRFITFICSSTSDFSYSLDAPAKGISKYLVWSYISMNSRRTTTKEIPRRLWIVISLALKILWITYMFFSSFRVFKIPWF